MGRYERLTVVTVLATLFLIAVGSTVRTTGSGLGCPDWPLCHGQLIPPMERTAIIEWSHRTVAAIVGVLILAQAVWTFRARASDRALQVLAVITLPLLAFQAYLGMVTVQRELPPEVVALHLFTALTLVAILGLMAAFAIQGAGRTLIDTPERHGFRKVALFALGTTAGVLAIGTYTVGTHAGFACTGWPGCPEAIRPFLDGFRLQHIHWLHRLTVLFGLGAVGLLFVYVVQMREEAPNLRRAAHALLGLYAVQIVVGAGNIWLDMSEAIRVTHLVVGSAIWTLLVVTAFAGRYRPAEAPPADDPRPVGRDAASHVHA
ncbi:MAG: COX15/CtaA family protein [Dehalococcoidia bacterium]